MNDRDEEARAVSGTSATMSVTDTANGEGPGRDGDGRSRRVLVAVDESETSIRAAKRAHELFGDDAKYLVVNVGARDLQLWGSDPMTWGVPYPLVLAGITPHVAPFYAEREDDAELSSAVDRAQAEARSVSTAAELPADSIAVGLTGDPIERIRQVADDESIDVIVVGAGAGGWWRHLFEPSVSAALVRAADRPVLVVP
jgi:nucleotide-binding universal stress UspA family protein